MSSRNFSSSWRGGRGGGARHNRGGGGRNFDRSDINSRLGSGNNTYNRFDVDGMSDAPPRNRASNPYSRGRGNRTNNPDRQNHSNSSRNPEVSVLGFRGGHIGSLLSHLEGACNSGLEIVESKQNNSEVIITVRSMDMARELVSLNGSKFAGSFLTIRHKNSHRKANGDEDKAKQIEAIKDFLQRRYDANQRLLDLSKMDGDPGLREAKLGSFSKVSVKSRLPDVYFKLASTLNIDPTTILFNCNTLTDLFFLENLGKYLPNVTNLSFESNNLATFGAISPLAECKDLKIEGLIFNDNPFKAMDIRKTEDDINYRSKIAELFPTLKILDGQEVQAAMNFGIEQTGDGGLMELPRKIGPPFCDSEITFNATVDFLGKFFSLYDHNRAALIDYYETSALFSVTINTELEDHRRGAGAWKDYFGVDRNLKKQTELATRTARLHMGCEGIIKLISTLPKTVHPTTEHGLFCFDAWQPDHMIPLGSTSHTFGAYIHITVHGEFTDVRSNTRRAFDRTFILSTPTEGSRSLMAGLQYTILSDALTLRSAPKVAAWNSTANTQPTPAQAMGTSQPAPPAMAPPQIAPPVATQAKLAVTVGPGSSLTPEQESLVQALQQRTNLVTDFALQCLVEFDWNIEVAYSTFQQLHNSGQLPPNAYMSV